MLSPDRAESSDPSPRLGSFLKRQLWGIQTARLWPSLPQNRLNFPLNMPQSSIPTSHSFSLPKAAPLWLRTYSQRWSLWRMTATSKVLTSLKYLAFPKVPTSCGWRKKMWELPSKCTRVITGIRPMNSSWRNAPWSKDQDRESTVWELTRSPSTTLKSMIWMSSQLLHWLTTPRKPSKEFRWTLVETTIWRRQGSMPGHSNSSPMTCTQQSQKSSVPPISSSSSLPLFSISLSGRISTSQIGKWAMKTDT